MLHHYFFLCLFFLADFAEPLTLPSMIDPGPSAGDSPTGAAPLGNSPPEESIAILTSMGFPRTHSIHALKATVSLLPTVSTGGFLATSTKKCLKYIR